MSWEDLHRRNRAITAVLVHARRTASTVLPFDLPEVRSVFATPQELVGALHYKWSQHVIAHMDYDIFERDHDPVTAARHAHDTVAAEEPILRELISANERVSDPRCLEHRYLGLAHRAVATETA